MSTIHLQQNLIINLIPSLYTGSHSKLRPLGLELILPFTIFIGIALTTGTTIHCVPRSRLRVHLLFVSLLLLLVCSSTPWAVSSTTLAVVQDFTQLLVSLHYQFCFQIFCFWFKVDRPAMLSKCWSASWFAPPLNSYLSGVFAPYLLYLTFTSSYFQVSYHYNCSRPQIHTLTIYKPSTKRTFVAAIYFHEIRLLLGFDYCLHPLQIWFDPWASKKTFGTFLV